MLPCTFIYTSAEPLDVDFRAYPSRRLRICSGRQTGRVPLLACAAAAFANNIDCYPRPDEGEFCI